MPAQPLRLHGEGLNLTRVQVNGASVSFRHEDGMLLIDSLPEGVFTAGDPQHLLAGREHPVVGAVHQRAAGLFTQCEPEGFRRITYFLDRPDVMAVYTVTLRASESRSIRCCCRNGNLLEQGAICRTAATSRSGTTRIPKPSYLFALVAADLVTREQCTFARAPARTTCCRSTCGAAISTRPNMR